MEEESYSCVLKSEPKYNQKILTSISDYCCDVLDVSTIIQSEISGKIDRKYVAGPDNYEQLKKISELIPPDTPRLAFQEKIENITEKKKNMKESKNTCCVLL